MANGQKNNSSKGKKSNWFVDQEKTKQEIPTKQSNSDSKHVSAGQTDYKTFEEAPILKMQMGSKKEEEHFEKALAFAMKVSDPKSEDIQTIHLNMSDELVFNMPKDEAYQTLWKSHRLLLLVAFPKNWKTMPLEAIDEEDGEPMIFEDDIDRFDYLYEVGMGIYEGEIK